jgi:hypothetical protein
VIVGLVGLFLEVGSELEDLGGGGVEGEVVRGELVVEGLEVVTGSLEGGLGVAQVFLEELVELCGCESVHFSYENHG